MSRGLLVYKKTSEFFAQRPVGKNSEVWCLPHLQRDSFDWLSSRCKRDLLDQSQFFASRADHIHGALDLACFVRGGDGCA